MFDDIFGDTALREHVRESQIHVTGWLLAVTSLLVEKGIVTEEEIVQRVDRCKAEIDQLAAEKRDDAIRELRENCPAMAKLFGI